jgi:hypothetical protein
MGLPQNLPRKEYLGDSVYAQTDGYYITLTTENSSAVPPSNIIHLEPEVLVKLLQYHQRVAEARRECLR